MLKQLCHIATFLIVVACVEPIAFDVPSVQFIMVVEGSITDQPGPYTVLLSTASSLKQDLDFRVGIAGATVTMFSDAGESEVLVERSRGRYETQSIQGVVGRSYWIRIETTDGVVYESEPEKLNAAGELNSITATFKDDEVRINGYDFNDDRFDIVVNATGTATSGNFMRWRTTGTYGILTFPHLIDTLIMGMLVPNPPECSGYVFDEQLRRIRGCTCCECWVTAYDRMPFVSDDTFFRGGEFKNVNIGAIPINGTTFYDKYHVLVEQISHTKKAYEYFKLLRAQKEGASSLFQPPFGKLRGNIHRVGVDEEVSGYFWAGGIATNSTFVTRNMVPYRVPWIDTMIIECNFLPNSTLEKPDFW